MNEAVFWRWTPNKCMTCEGLPDCRLPNGTCRELQGEPTPKWPPDFAAAVEIYNRAAFLSGIDANGYPQLTKLEFVFEMADNEIEDKARFLEYIESLHSWNIRLVNETRK